MRAGPIIATLSATLLAAVAQQALAHHAFDSNADCNAPIKISGHVTAVEWTNPHVWVHLTVAEPGKGSQDWMFGGGTPNTLVRMGLTQAMLKPGEAVTVYGWKAKDQSCKEAAATGKPTCKGEGHMLSLDGAPPIIFGASGTGAPPPYADWPVPAPTPQRLDANGRPLVVGGTYLKSGVAPASGEVPASACPRASG